MHCSPSEVLDHRQRTERQCVSAIADIIENTSTFRGMPNSRIFDSFGDNTKKFSSAHLKAVTEGWIEMIQGMLLAGLFFISTLMVNKKTLSNGEEVGIISAFVSASKDIVDISAIALKMKFNSEGLRVLSKILNLPIDAHVLVQEQHSKDDIIKRHMQVTRMMRRVGVLRAILPLTGLMRRCLIVIALLPANSSG